jgi:hypothetical protein
MEELHDYEFPPKQAKYDWGKIFDGHTWKLTRHIDYHGDTKRFRSTVYAAARRAKRIVITTSPNENSVVVRCVGKKEPRRSKP